MKEIKYVVVYGDVSFGITKIVGPFDTRDAAHDYGEADTSDSAPWHVIEMELP